MGVVRLGSGCFGRSSAAPACGRNVDPESTFGEPQPDAAVANHSQSDWSELYNPTMREYKDVTRKRGGDFSSFDNPDPTKLLEPHILVFIFHNWAHAS